MNLPSATLDDGAGRLRVGCSGFCPAVAGKRSLNRNNYGHLRSGARLGQTRTYHKSTYSGANPIWMWWAAWISASRLSMGG